MASIKCGHCEGIHQSVADVRKCFGALPTAEVVTEETLYGEEAVVPPSGANFFLTNTAQVLYDHAQSERANLSLNNVAVQQFPQDREEGKTYINCPYAEKDEAKALGARWDADRRSWYVPAGVGLAAFARWRGGQNPKGVSPEVVTSTGSSGGSSAGQPEAGATARRTSCDKVTEDGMYKVGDQIFKVQWNQERSHLYAKALQKDEDGKWFFSFVPGGLHRIRPEHKMSKEDAKSFGALYGTCCVCGKTLTNEESIDRGIGPVCANKNGWL